MDHLHFVVHTHWDREWYQPFQQMRARLVAMADRMIPLVESGEIPFFHFDGQTIVLDDYLEIRPEMASRLKRLIGAGKIQVGPWYVLADSFLVSGESLIRNLEIGIASARRFGRPLDVGYLPDQFGHIAQLPQILSRFGFRTAVLWRGVGADVNRNRFIWEALDGSSVLTTYLPYGYSNGANLPLDSIESFLDRARATANKERAFANGDPILVMNGTDHAAPDPRLTARVREARETSAMTLEIGTLQGYIDGIANQPVDGIPRHRGELRSPLRAHLLPGVTSARAWIKQRDFHNCYLLERLADPLAALANTRGVGAGLAAWLDAAWKVELQNHPHDSICGCSVDQVHSDMRYRFDQAAMMAENVVRRASEVILSQRLPAGASSTTVAVFNPTFATQALVTAEIELRDPSANYFAEGPHGRFPVVIEVGRQERTVETPLSAAEFKPMVAALSHPTLMGRTINDYDIRNRNGRIELDLFVSRAALSDLNLEEFRAQIRNEVPDDARLLIRATSAARATVWFVADGLTQAGFTFLRISTDGNAAPLSVQARDSIENEFYRLRKTERGLAFDDLSHQTEFELHFEDEGDRGDEYNYDPVPGASVIDKPVSLRVRSIESNHARQRMAIELEYAIPSGLTTDRGARDSTSQPLTIELIATLYRGLDRIDLEARVMNRSCDHRLRAAIKTPIVSADCVHDTSFGVVRRPLKQMETPGTEDIYPTSPHRIWSAIESDTVSCAVLSRGLYEVEARHETGGTTLLLTLLRSVGWLSRSDLKTRRGGAGPELETPGAQELGEHRFEFALVGFRGRYLDTDLVQRAAAYAYPPRTFTARGAHPEGLSLVRCDNSRVAFSTARIESRAGRYRVRVYSASPTPERARFNFGDGAKARLIDLAGRPQKPARAKRRRNGDVDLELRPFEIVTFDVRCR